MSRFRPLSPLAAAAALAVTLPAQLPQLDWVRQFGRTAPATDFATSVDAAGNIYVVGSELVPGTDGYLRKYDANGVELWTRFVSTAGTDNLTDVAVDASGVVVVGSTTGSLPGFTNAGLSDVVLRRYDHDGNLLWTRQFGTASSDVLNGVTMIGGDVYAVGSTGAALPGQTWAGSTDAFVVKCDASGATAWLRQFGTAAGEAAQAVRASGSTLLVGGQAFGSLFAPLVGSGDAFVCTFDTAGTPGWNAQFGSTANENLLAIATDGAAFFVAGTTFGTLPGQVSSGASDVYVARFALTGGMTWLQQFGSSGSDLADGLAADANGVYVGGSVNAVLPGQVGSGGQDAFVRRLDASGATLWTRQFGTSGSDTLRGLAVTGTGVVSCGQTTGVFPGQAGGGTDSFVRVFDAAGSESWTRQFTFMQVTTSIEQATAVAADGSIYIAGTFRVGPSAASDCFVRKYDAAGGELWTREFGSSGEDDVRGLAIDGTTIYVAGVAGGALPGQVSAGGSDAFVKKLDASGTEAWTRQFGTATEDNLRAIVVASGSVFVCGLTRGPLDGQANDGNDADAYVRKIDGDGTHVWTRLTIGTGASFVHDQANALAIHGTDVYVGGHSSGSVDGQPFAGNWDGWVRKYDAVGTSLWTREFGSAPSTDGVTGLATDASGVYACGFGENSLRKFSHSGTAEWARPEYTRVSSLGSAVTVVGGKLYVAAAGDGVRGRPSYGGDDAVVVQYDALGNPGWTFEIGSMGGDAATCIAWSGNRLVFGGLANGALPGQTYSGTQDAFVVALRLGEGPIDTIAPVADAGPDAAVHVQQNTSVSGLASYDDTSLTTALFFEWTLVARPPAGPFGTWPPLGHRVEGPTFSLTPDSVGEYRWQLVVSDEQGNRSAPDEVVVSSLNQAPTADAGADQIVVVNGYAYFDGWSSVDPDDDTLFLSWTIVSAPAGSQAVLGTMGTPTLAALSPDLPGTYVLQLVASDYWSSSAPDFVTLVAITASQWAQQKLQEACALVHAMTAADFDAAGHQQSLCNQMAQVATFLQHGNTALAVQHLGELLTRVDGFSVRYALDPKGAGQPFAADFVVTYEAQLAVYALLHEALTTLQP